MSNRKMLIGLLLLYYSPARAQLNNDYKQIAKKKIEMVMSFHVDIDGDTIFTRYFYDNIGRITRIEDGCWNEVLTISTYDSQGNELSFLELHPRINMDTVHSREDAEKYRKRIQYDTVERREASYFPGTGRLRYMLNVDYQEGICVGGSLLTTHGDTTFLFDALRPYQYELTEFKIIERVDSIENGWATTSYKVKNKDTTYYGCEIKVYDKRGGLIRYYLVIPKTRPTHVHKVSGKLYTPFGESDTEIKLLQSYENKYRRNGTLEKRTFVDHVTNTTETYEYPDEKANQFYSLASLKVNNGTLIYKYYK